MASSSRARWRAGMLVVGLVAWAVAGPVRAAQPVEVETTELRNYEVPAGFPLAQRIVESSGSGKTLIASTSGKGSVARCLVVVASGQFARAYPYRHAGRGTRCVDAIAHPKGGFFVRGVSTGAGDEEITGFSARVDARGRERWVVRDTATAESDRFRGVYRRPGRSMAYSPESNDLLTFAIGEISTGFGSTKEITHASVLGQGEVRVAAETLGSSSGFGRVGEVATLEATGEFLLYIYQPGLRGAEFLTYDGRLQVEGYRPLGESWAERFVRGMRYGPDEHVYLLWTEETGSSGPTHVSVSDLEGQTIWSEAYPHPVELPGKPPSSGRSAADAGRSPGVTHLGAPRGMWAGREHVVISYVAGRNYLRVLDADNGRQMGIVAAGKTTDLQPLNILVGADGGLKLLAVDSQKRRFHELRLDFGAEAGSSRDVGVGNVGLDAGHPGRTKGGNRGGGCSAVGSSGPSPPAALLLVVLLLWPRLRRCQFRALQIH